MAIREDIKLTAVQRQILTDMQVDIEWLESQIFKAEKANLDVEDLKDKLTDLQKTREGLLREYG